MEENINEVRNELMKRVSALEVENMQLHQKSQELTRQLLELTEDDESWKEKLDPEQELELTQIEAECVKSKAEWENMKHIASAIVVGSGVDWADDEDLAALVLDESND